MHSFKIGHLEIIANEYSKKLYHHNISKGHQMAFDIHKVSSSINSDSSSLVSAHLAKIGLKQKALIAEDLKFIHIPDIIHAITSMVGRFSFIRILQNFANIGHAQSLYFDGKTWFFLDPTYGEIKCRSASEIIIWYTRFMKWAYKDPVTSFSIENF